MSKKTSLFVHRMSATPGAAGDDRFCFPHREITGWGIADTCGCIADTGLLLLAHELKVDRSLLEPDGAPDANFRDDQGLLDVLADQGLLLPVDSMDFSDGLAETVSELVDECAEDFGTWLAAQAEVATAWAEQEALVCGIWETLDPDPEAWRQRMRSVGLSVYKHNFRNQNQAVTALQTLVEWQADDIEAELIHEAIDRETFYLFASVLVGAQMGAIIHDWSDLLPVYLRLAPEAAKPVLCLRTPSLKAGSPERVAEILTLPEIATARDMVADALDGGSVTGMDIEKTLLRAVPREDRAPYAFRQVEFYEFAQEAPVPIALPTEGIFAISRWQSSVQPSGDNCAR